MSLAAELIEELQPYIDADPAGGWDTRLLLEAIGAMAEPVASVVRDGPNGEPGWSALFDPDRCPAEWLWLPAQIVGVRLVPGEGEVASRLRIKGGDGQQRGTIMAQVMAVQFTLTGTRTVVPVERWQGNAWKQRFYTLIDETPNPAATRAAWKSQKPIGITFQHDLYDGVTWKNIADTGWTWQQTLDAFATWDDVKAH